MIDMYKGINSSPTDLIPGLTIPILQSVPNQSIPLRSNLTNDLNVNTYETKIYSNTSILYKNFLDWDKVFMIKLPEQLSALPALVTNDGKICINMTAATVHQNLAKHTIVVEDPNDFAACVLYGLNMVILLTKNDPTLLSSAFHGIVDFIYSLLTRIYAHDIDFTKIEEQDIANMYCAVAKMVIINYLGLEGSNVNGVARTLTHYFFTHDTRSKISYDPSILPITPDIEINTWNSLFEYFNTQSILPSTSLEDFRNGVIRSLGLTSLLCMSNGLSFASMLLTCRLPSNIFNQNVIKVRPAATNDLFSNVLHVLTKEQMKQREKEKLGGLLSGN